MYPGYRSVRTLQNTTLENCTRETASLHPRPLNNNNTPGQKTAYEIMPSLVGSEMCIRDRAYRAYRSSGYGYESCTELTEVPGTGMNVLENLQKFFVG